MTLLNISLFISKLGAPEIILIIVALLILFGGKKIPELMKGLGSGIKEFKNASKEENKNDSTAIEKKEE
ncbi:Sec-independent protein translocase subunit TatA/TatB [Capnocytophaga cynodegmi]|uniref:Sec-independent protein translocase protein TatA n=1 Tax=Capnocytophaga cynodegmi TaxID=28189 RepID=A0A0B7H5T6_9FLAO|nr:twin-arginine translocase TatA/TatE family subunit [Capnocytophaga cynodegmi]ATA68675.1 twin-arginine translocase TatA/TatE family subunit [Capnocytophaga cynodegmi]CEN32588.1 Sec-independent protein translocase protein TatA [Capnocytophaga cynodegmi]CEN33899.1 Sec-independent protein translocase protein TatA [Capnocytophaga cynodegmi]CEN41150.1 Sec-independent protein translocase protein TatA [Capnocytophaga cynodegmi]GIM52855.1 Sec-independent protein translocase protein TatA [Capnocytoph